MEPRVGKFFFFCRYLSQVITGAFLTNFAALIFIHTILIVPIITINNVSKSRLLRTSTFTTYENCYLIITNSKITFNNSINKPVTSKNQFPSLHNEKLKKKYLK